MDIFVDETSKNSRYEKVCYLGEGQFANVFLAQDNNRNGQLVAIKKVNVFLITYFDNKMISWFCILPFSVLS